MRVSRDPATSKPRRPSRRIDSIFLAGPGLLYVALLLLLPAGALVLLSLQNPETGRLELAVYRDLFSAGIYVQTLLNTFVIAAQVTVVCIFVGYVVAAWLTVMSEERRRLAIWLVLLPVWVSPLLKNFAWIVLLARRGIVAQLLTGLGYEGEINLLFGRGAVVFGMAHALLPIAILTMLPTMMGIDRRLLSASQTMGASRSQSFWRIFLPLSMPGVTAAGLLIFIIAIGFFITPALLGSPSETMIGQMMITQVQQFFNMRLAGALATLLLAVTLVVVVVYDRIFGISAASGGGSGDARPRSTILRRIGHGVLGTASALTDLLGRVGFGALGMQGLSMAAILVVALLIVPVVAFPPMAFSGSSFLEFPPKSFSLQWFERYLTDPLWTGATLRSIGISIVTGILATLLAGLAAYGMARTKTRLGSIAFLLFLMPMIVPNIVIAVALFYIFAKLGLVATDLGIALGHTLTAMPIVFVIMLTTFRGFDWRLGDAAGTLGASPWQRIRHVFLPLVRGGAMSAFLFGLLHSFDELTIALFVGGGVKQTLPKKMWDDILLSVSPTLAAAAVVVILLVTILFVIAERSRPK
ncbi:ABC transporter permease subunit [Defluviimonas sp. SAOS-178_SWC]|uniref:ABC transporter permease subunit n=1 Tax=Defluviimonas sp. SAOS-178_SWC TaxID=3121287 RepID=UPI003221B901